MYGYIFEVTNKVTGKTYLGKRYSVSFDAKYFGEEANRELALDLEKYGRPAFEAKMIMPYEEQSVLDAVFDDMKKASIKKVEPKPEKKKVEPKKEESKVEEPKEEEPVEEKAPAKRGRKKAVEAE